MRLGHNCERGKAERWFSTCLCVTCVASGDAAGKGELVLNVSRSFFRLAAGIRERDSCSVVIKPGRGD